MSCAGFWVLLVSSPIKNHLSAPNLGSFRFGYDWTRHFPGRMVPFHCWWQQKKVGECYFCLGCFFPVCPEKTLNGRNPKANHLGPGMFLKPWKSWKKLPDQLVQQFLHQQKVKERIIFQPLFMIGNANFGENICCLWNMRDELLKIPEKRKPVWE